MYPDLEKPARGDAAPSGRLVVSEAILTAGQATADNLPAGLAEIQYMIRVPTIAMAEQVTAVLDRNAAAAALLPAAGTSATGSANPATALPITP
jgi:metal-dependent amidase/aminoacylase/carboxypeptidase family protein